MGWSCYNSQNLKTSNWIWDAPCKQTYHHPTLTIHKTLKPLLGLGIILFFFFFFGIAVYWSVVSSVWDRTRERQKGNGGADEDIRGTYCLFSGGQQRSLSMIFCFGWFSQWMNDPSNHSHTLHIGWREKSKGGSWFKLPNHIHQTFLFLSIYLCSLRSKYQLVTISACSCQASVKKLC